MQNMLTAMDVMPSAADRINMDQAAARMAAYGDTVQQNKLALRVQQMHLAELEKTEGVKNYLAQYGGLDATAPQPAMPSQPVAPPQMTNMLAGPGATGPMPAAPPQIAGGVGAGMPLPATDLPPTAPTSAAATPQPAAAPAAGPGKQYPSDQQLMEAVKAGKIPMDVANGVRAERVQFEQMHLQEQTKAKLAMVTKWGEKYAEAGDDEGFQRLWSQVRADPQLAPYVPAVDSVSVPRKGEVETVKKWTQPEIAKLAEKFPELGIDPANTPEGTYKTVTKLGSKQITKWEPVKDIEKASKTPQQLRSVFTNPAAPQADRDAAWNDFKLGATNTQFQAIAVDKTMPAEYRQFAQSVLDAEDKRAAKKTEIRVNLQNPGGNDPSTDFGKWKPEDKTFWFETKQRTGEMPNFGWGKAAAKSRSQFAQEYSQWAQKSGLSAAEAGAGKEDFKADAGSLKFVTKQLDASGAFIKTIDGNIAQLETHIGNMSKTLNLDRNRLLNMGVRDFNKKLVGTANINIYDMLVSAISTENAKLQAGGAGSVAQVAEGARTEMARIHDNNLPVSEMIKLMKATRQEGGNRIKALQDQRFEVQKRMKGARAGAGGGDPLGIR
jgi:hypothetical protein